MHFSPTRLAFGVLTFSKGIGWCVLGGRFPQRRRLVPLAPAARFPPNRILAAQKNLGACLWGHKKPLQEWGHALPRFSSQKHGFGLQKNPGACFWGHKKPLREWGHALPGFGQVLVSNPGASGVRRPRASPLGNLTTVGHLAKASLDLGFHFQTQKHIF